MAYSLQEHDVQKIVNQDCSPLRGPLPRWKRKAIARGNLSGNGSLNCSSTGLSTSWSGPSTNRSLNSSCSSPSIDKRSKTPSSFKGNSSLTPGRKLKGKTPKRDNRDRFIPQRNEENFNASYYKLTQGSLNEEEEFLASRDYCQAVKSIVPAIENPRILTYNKTCATASLGHLNPMRGIYEYRGGLVSKAKSSRHIPQQPERVLDAPYVRNDFYLHVIDWGHDNVIAVALNNKVYLWNAETAEVQLLPTLPGGDDSYVTSLSWSRSPVLAVATSCGDIQLWDTVQMRRLRVMEGHHSRVPSLSWNDHVLSSGSSQGILHHHDVREQQHLMQAIEAHQHEICGLKWSPNNHYLASGGNDNLVQIWSLSTGTTPLHSFSTHSGAVKALSWCPWQNSVIASGGGMADRSICFWNCCTGFQLNKVDAQSQVCSLLWSSNYRELVSGHGYGKGQVIIWKYPSLAKVAELKGHNGRVLDIVMSPDGSTVASLSADETLRFWSCFKMDYQKIKKGSKSTNIITSSLIR